MCGKPVRNGEPGYSWDGKSVGVYPVNPPDLAEGDTLLYDEPGRCGGLDSHCHHFRVVLAHGINYLLVRHGAGDERIDLGSRPGIKAFCGMDSTSRYWMLQMLYNVQHYAARDAERREHSRWTHAAAEKRIKTRKLPKSGTVKVWIEDKPCTNPS
jgi:hypothetical protein